MSTSGAEQQPPGVPPPYAAHPAPHWAAPPVRRRRSRWLTVGLPLGGVLLLGGCATAVGLLINSVRGDLAPATRAADAYASAVVDERWDDLHDLLCAEQQASVTPENLAAHYAAPDRTGYRLEGVDVSNVNGQKSARAEISFTTPDGLRDRETLPMVADGEAWRPCP